MRCYITSVFMILAYTGFAQSTFTKQNCFQLNDSAKLGFAIVNESFDAIVLKTGNNFTWDFSSTGSPGPWTDWESPTVSYVFQPSSNSIHTPFVGTEINEYAALPFARDHFYTYSSNNDTLLFNGFYTSANRQYSPPVPYLSFPLSFNDSIHTITTQWNDTINMGTVTRYWIYDGFGTVKLPYGSESNVYRIRTKQVDSSAILSSVISTSEEIIWFRQADGIPILRFEKQGPSIFSAYYASVLKSSLVYSQTYSEQVQIYPNPTTDIVHINTQNGSQVVCVSVYDVQGKLVKFQEGNVHEADISNLKKGIYILSIELSNSSTLVKRCVKK